jgi:GntR family transcriptional regulator
MSEPMYRRIAEDLRSQIESGQLPQGGQLPTEIDLREQYGASRNTIRDAIKWLIARGLVETRPGQGTFVIEKVTPFITTLTGDPATGLGGGEGGVYEAEVAKSHRQPGLGNLRVELQKADHEVATALRIDEGTQVVSRQEERFIDATPWSIQTSFYPMELVLRRGATKLLEATSLTGGSVAYLREQCGIRQVGYRDTISVRPPDENEARFFRLPSDGRVSVFDVFRVAFDQDGERFRFTLTAYPTDRNRLRLDVGTVPPPSEAQPGVAGSGDGLDREDLG